jgi:2-C-methyl-D-erythritol 4-phosphate cytidylyltransferase
MYVTAIVLAAGRGLRYKAKLSKPLLQINGQPVIIYCLKIISSLSLVRDIIVVVNPQNLNRIKNKLKQYRIKKMSKVILGGQKRQDSVRNALEVVDSRADFILIHDGVRPFIDRNTVLKAIKEAKRCGAAIVGVPVKSTIKVVAGRRSQVAGNFMVKKTLDRNELWEIQTPQVFKKELILEAYKKFGDAEVTDDAMLVEKLGAKVSVVLGSYQNIKITTPEDLAIAKAIAKIRN